MIRDFTYIDDIVESVIRVIDRPAASGAATRAAGPVSPTSNAPYRIFNIGNNTPVKLLQYIAVLEQALGVKATLELLPMQAGDVRATMADMTELERAVGYRPTTPIEVGVTRFVEWYKSYYQS